MQLKTSVLVAFCAGFLLPACTGTGFQNTQPPAAEAKIAGSHARDTSAYTKNGMEVSAITSRMADELQTSLFYYLLPDAPTEQYINGSPVKIVTMPRVAVTSFVDTDTYEDSGYLGRAVAEFFTHELSSRAFEVTEYKLTGVMSVTKDGEYILSRNWKKIAKDTKVKYLLGGTMTRNDKGVVLVARIIDMKTHHVVATASDIVPYQYLPECYRTSKKNCSFTGTSGFTNPAIQAQQLELYKKRVADLQKRLNAVTAAENERMQYDADAKKAMTKARIVSSSGRPLGGVFLTPSYSAQGAAVPVAVRAEGTTVIYDNGGNAFIAVDPRFKDRIVAGATSRGNYDRFIQQRDDGDMFYTGNGDAVVYPANTYMHNTLLIRDTADESSYSRVH